MPGVRPCPESLLGVRPESVERQRERRDAEIESSQKLWRWLLVAVLGSYYVFLKYAKLWELGRGGDGRLTASAPPPTR